MDSGLKICPLEPRNALRSDVCTPRLRTNHHASPRGIALLLRPPYGHIAADFADQGSAPSNAQNDRWTGALNHGISKRIASQPSANDQPIFANRQPVSGITMVGNVVDATRDAIKHRQFEMDQIR